MEVEGEGKRWRGRERGGAEREKGGLTGIVLVRRTKI